MSHIPEILARIGLILFIILLLLVNTFDSTKPHSEQERSTFPL